MTATEAQVEIFWPSALPPDGALLAQQELLDAGVAASCRLQPTRRGPELIVLVLLTSPPVTAFLEAVFGRFAEDAYGALRRFVGHLLHGAPARTPLHGVVFESSTGARVVFTPGLPVEAFRKALEIVPEQGAGTWTWDPTIQEWLRSTGAGNGRSQR